jgi:microcystin-dependent protein
VADPFVAEIRIVPFNFAPVGWALCDGQLMPISQNTALFSLLGTTYGGDGRSNFALPNLQGAAPVAPGQGPGLSNRVLGETGGQASVTLVSSQMPAHAHVAQAGAAAGSQTVPAGNTWAAPGAGRGLDIYDPAPGSGPAMHAQALGVSGAGQPHNNLPPVLAFNFIIALQGIFPARP